MITYITMQRGTTRETRTREEDPSHFSDVVSNTIR